MNQKIPSSFSGLEHLATAVILLDGARHVVYANPGAEGLFAFSAKQIIGMPVEQVFPNCEILSSAIENALKTGSPFREHEFFISTLTQHPCIFSPSPPLQVLGLVICFEKSYWQYF